MPVEPLLAHFEIGAGQRFRGKLLDGKADRFRGLGKTPVAEGGALVFAVIGRNSSARRNNRTRQAGARQVRREALRREKSQQAFFAAALRMMTSSAKGDG